MVTGVIWVLDDFYSSAFAAFEVDAERGEQTLGCAQLSAHLSAELCSPGLWCYYTTLRCTESQYTFYGPWIESFQDSWWEFPQLSQMVQSLSGFLNLGLNVCSPSLVLGDVYTEVLEAAHPLHRGPTDHKRSVGPLLSLPEVYNQLFSFAHVQRETVILAPWCTSLYLIQVCGLIIVGNEAQNPSIISKFNNRGGAVRGHAVVCVERVEQGAQDTALWGSYAQGDGVGGELAHFHHLWSASEEVLKCLGRGLRVWQLAWWGLLYWKLSYSQWIAAWHSCHFLLSMCVKEECRTWEMASSVDLFGR